MHTSIVRKLHRLLFVVAEHLDFSHAQEVSSKIFVGAIGLLLITRLYSSLSKYTHGSPDQDQTGLVSLHLSKYLPGSTNLSNVDVMHQVKGVEEKYSTI